MESEFWRERHGRRKLTRFVMFFALLLMLCIGSAMSVHAATAGYQRATVNRNRDDIIIFVGDSRTAHYYSRRVKDPEDCLVYCSGARINDLRYNRQYQKCSTLGKYLRNALAAYPNAKVVFNFGCNGAARRRKNAKALVKEYRKWMRAYPDREFYIASVFPACMKKGSYTRTNMHYANAALLANFPNVYIDAGEFLERSGLAMMRADGKGFRRLKSGKFDRIHYSRYACRQVKNYIRSAVMSR